MTRTSVGNADVGGLLVLNKNGSLLAFLNTVVL